MSQFIEQIQQVMKDAMRNKEQEKLSTLRLMLSDLKKFEIDLRSEGKTVELTDAQVINVLNKMVKQRREAAEQYMTANRSDLADKENNEILVIEAFLPQPLSEAEIDQAIEQAIDAVNPSSMRDMGGVMAHIGTIVQGRADMKSVSAKVKSRLATL